MRIQKPNEQKNDEATALNLSDFESKEPKYDDKTIWKAKKKLRREYFCTTCPTIVITPVDSKLLPSHTSIMKLFGDDRKQLAPKVKTYTFSQTRRTLYLHFDGNQISWDDMKQVASRFNESHPPEEEIKNEDASTFPILELVELDW